MDDLRLRCIRQATEASRRAGYRTTPPPNAEAGQWVCSVQAGEDEDDRPVHRLIWSPRKEAEDWQRARFGPCELPGAGHGAASERNGQEGKEVPGDAVSLLHAGELP
jgi:hypothetical protein